MPLAQSAGSHHVEVVAQLAHEAAELHRLVEAPLVVAGDGQRAAVHVVDHHAVQLRHLIVGEQRDEAVAPGEHDDVAVAFERLVDHRPRAVPVDLTGFGEDRGQRVDGAVEQGADFIVVTHLETSGRLHQADAAQPVAQLIEFFIGWIGRG